MTFKPNYITDHIGRVRKISNLSERQTNNSIAQCNHKIVLTKNQLDLLYERRAHFQKEKVEPKKSIRKIKEWLRIKDDDSERLKQILIFALSQMQKENPDIPLIISILEQARDKND